jgi:hypothetical protein
VFNLKHKKAAQWAALFVPEFAAIKPLRGFGLKFGKALGQQVFELDQRGGEAFNAFLELVGGHAVGGVHGVKRCLVHSIFRCSGLGRFGIELARQVGFGCFKLGKQLRGDGEQVAAGQLLDLADVAEAGAHDQGLVAEFLVVVVDLGDGLDAGIVGALVILAGVFLVPVEDAADEGRDEGNAGIGAAMAW